MRCPRRSGLVWVFEWLFDCLFAWDFDRLFGTNRRREPAFPPPVGDCALSDLPTSPWHIEVGS